MSATKYVRVIWEENGSRFDAIRRAGEHKGLVHWLVQNARVVIAVVAAPEAKRERNQRPA